MKFKPIHNVFELGISWRSTTKAPGYVVRRAFGEKKNPSYDLDSKTGSSDTAPARTEHTSCLRSFKPRSMILDRKPGDLLGVSETDVVSLSQ